MYKFECIYTKKETVSHILQKVKTFVISQFESHQVFKIEVGIDLRQKPSFYVKKTLHSYLKEPFFREPPEQGKKISRCCQSLVTKAPYFFFGLLSKGDRKL
jgi:hypothetical protein